MRSARAVVSGLGRRFWALWSAVLLSGLGDGVVLVAFPLLAAQLSKDPRYVSGAAAAAALPWLLFALPAGVLADRLDRRRLMIRLEWFRALVVGVLALAVVADRVTLTVVYLVAFLLGAAQTLFVAAAGIEVPNVVPGHLLGRGNGYLLAAETAGEQTIGPAIGGALFAVTAAAPFFLDSVSFLVSAALIPLALGAPVVGRGSARLDLGVVGRQLRAGWRYFIDDDLLVVLVGLIAVLAFAQAMMLSTLVLSAFERWGLGESGFGVLLGCAAVGNVIGGLVGGRIEERFGTAATLSGTALAGGIGYAVVGFSSHGVVAAVGLGVEAAAVMIGNVASITLRQRIVPRSLLGTVGNVMRWFIFGAVPIGALVGGLLADQHSLRTPVLTAATLQFVAVGLFSCPLATLIKARGFAPTRRRLAG